MVIEGPIVCPGHARQVSDICFSQVLPDGSFLMLTACVDGKPMLRDGASGDWIGTFEGHNGAVWCARFNRTADRVVTASADYTARLWDATSGEELHSWEMKGLVKASVFSVDNTQVYAGGFDKKLLVLDAVRHDSPAQELVGHQEHLTHIVALPDDHLILSAGKGRDVFVWDKRTGQIARRLPTEAKVSSLSADFAGSTVSVTSGTSQVSLYRSDTLELVRSLTLPRETDCVAFDPPSVRLLTGGREEWVRVYHSETGEELGRYKGHHGPISALAASPLGQTFASGSDDASVRIWDWNKDRGAAP